MASVQRLNEKFAAAASGSKIKPIYISKNEMIRHALNYLGNVQKRTVFYSIQVIHLKMYFCSKAKLRYLFILPYFLFNDSV